MIKEIVSRLVETDTKKKKGIFVSMYLATSIIQPTNYPTIHIPFSQFPRRKERMETYPVPIRHAHLYTYTYTIGFVNRMWQKRWRVKRSILHGLLKGCDGPEAAGAGGAWLRFRFGESDGRRRRRRWGGAAPLPPPVQPTVPQSRAEPAGWPSASAQPAVPQTRRLLEHRDRRSEKGAGGFELVERGATVQQKAQAGAAGQSHAAGDVPSSSASTAGILHSVISNHPLLQSPFSRDIVFEIDHWDWRRFFFFSFFFKDSSKTIVDF